GLAIFDPLTKESSEFCPVFVIEVGAAVIGYRGFVELKRVCKIPSPTTPVCEHFEVAHIGHNRCVRWSLSLEVDPAPLEELRDFCFCEFGDPVFHEVGLGVSSQEIAYSLGSPC